VNVAESFLSPAPTLVGRTQELGIIRSLLARSAAGEAQSLLISGDAGIGKTALVRKACADFGPESVALVGACLPLSSISIPFLPLRTAVRAHQREHPQHERVLDQGGGKDFIEHVDDWLDESTALAPMILVVDDLHWADQSTLDALMYVISGPPDRRLTIVATYRKTELTIDHPVRRWLTDIRRLPRITEMAVEALDREETGEQISELLGASAHQSLIDDVHRRTLGNPYFTKLMVSGLPAETRAVSDAVPDDLRSAVLRSWNSVGEATRHLATVLAVGARPMRADELAVVTARESAAVSSLLAPALSGGSLERTVDGAYWFHHPLNAEVLEAVLEPDERRALHARFADMLEERVKDHPLAAEDAVSIADHRHRAGDAPKAYAWALAAADALRDSGGSAEQLRLLRRAIALHERIPAPRHSRGDLLRRLRETAARAGEHSDELDAVEALLAGTDPAADPLAVSELIVRRMHLRFSLARAFIDQTEMREAVRLSASAPKSAEHALALAELAHADIWSDDPLAPEHARAALEAARASGDSRASAYALTANAMVAVVAEDGASASVFASEALECALDA
jgi:predicted ATPase